MKIKDCLGICNAKLIMGDENYIFEGFSKDTRTIQNGDTYVGIKGETFDGNLFFEDAFLNGADTCVLDHVLLTDEIRKKYSDKNIILVDDTVLLIMELAKKKREQISVPVIAITGSVGKTSTKKIVVDTLETKYSVLASVRNENTKIGMSLRILNYQNEEMIVLEMGMNQAGEIRDLTNIAKPDVAIITNVGMSHIGNLGSRENILKAKLEILEGLSGPIIVNNDNDLLHDWIKRKEYAPIITFGIHEVSDYQAMNVSYEKKGTTYKLNGQNIFVPVIGDAFVYNSLVAFIIGDLYSVSHEKIEAVLRELKTESHRMEFIYEKNYTIIDDTYNASYDSVAFSLSVLQRLDGRKIAVLGDIFELGEYGEEVHRQIGKLVVSLNMDVLITVGELSRYIDEEAINLGFSSDCVFHFDTNIDAICYLKQIIQSGDVILVKASHGMNFLEIVDALKEGYNG